MRACLARDVNINERVRTCCALVLLVYGNSSRPIENRNRPLQAYGKQKQRVERAYTRYTLHASLVGKDRVDGANGTRSSILKSIQLYGMCQTLSQTRLREALRAYFRNVSRMRCGMSKSRLSGTTCIK